MRAQPVSVLLCVAVVAVIASIAHADVYVPPDHRVLGLDVRRVRALDVSAPAIDRDAAIAAVEQSMSGFRARIEACIASRDPRSREGRPGGTVRARVRYERSELPTRHSVVESSLGASARACVAEVLPSLLIRPAPRGELTIEITLGRGWARPW